MKPRLPSSYSGGKSRPWSYGRCRACLSILALILSSFSLLYSSYSSVRIGCFTLSRLIPCGMSCCSCLSKSMFRPQRLINGTCRISNRSQTSRKALTSNFTEGWLSVVAYSCYIRPIFSRLSSPWPPRISLS